MEHERWRVGERATAVAVCVAVLGATLSPLIQYRRPLNRRRDGFPLSWYPMFSAERAPRSWITHVAGVRADGSLRYLPSHLLGPGGINQVRRQLYRAAVREQRADQVAAVVAARVAGRADCDDVVTVQVVRTRFDLDHCLLTGAADGKRRVLASVPVVRVAA